MWFWFKEFLKVARQEKKWLLIPLIVILLAVVAVIVFAANSGIAWTLYPFK